MYFFKKYKDRMIVALVAVILLIIIGLTNSDRLGLTSGEKLLGNLLTPLNKVTSSIGNRVSGFFSNIGNVWTLMEENEEQKILIAKLEEENRKMEDIIGKSDFLRMERALIENASLNFKSAAIIAKEPGNWYDRFIIDKGLNDGLEKGDTVVQGVEVEKNLVQKGLVGRISDLGDNWAKVTSIIDELNTVSFKISRTQDGGVLSGSVHNEVSGYLFDSKADVIVGDKVFTSGLGGIFEKDIYIGEVEEVVYIEEELMKRIVVKPAIDFKKLYDVFIIID